MGSILLFYEHPPGPGLVRHRDRWHASIRTLKDMARRHDAEVVYGHEADQLDRILDGWPP